MTRKRPIAGGESADFGTRAHLRYGSRKFEDVDGIAMASPWKYRLLAAAQDSRDGLTKKLED
jgi:hypothetical protein